MKQIIFIAILLTCAFGACSSDNDGDEQSASVQAPSDITIERMGKTTTVSEIRFRCSCMLIR